MKNKDIEILYEELIKFMQYTCIVLIGIITFIVFSPLLLLFGISELIKFTIKNIKQRINKIHMRDLIFI